MECPVLGSQVLAEWLGTLVVFLDVCLSGSRRSQMFGSCCNMEFLRYFLWLEYLMVASFRTMTQVLLGG